jgi:hypothetical protein
MTLELVAPKPAGFPSLRLGGIWWSRMDASQRSEWFRERVALSKVTSSAPTYVSVRTGKVKKSISYAICVCVYIESATTLEVALRADFNVLRAPGLGQLLILYSTTAGAGGDCRVLGQGGCKKFDLVVPSVMWMERGGK